MKIKIIIVPVLIVLIVVLAIWVVNPALQEWGDKKASLNKIDAQLADIQEKNQKAQLLASAMNADPGKMDVIMKYIPPKEQEEEMIASLNALANASGLAVYNISVDSGKNNPAGGAQTPAEATPAVNASGIAGSTQTAVGPSITDFTITFGVAGGYEKIKDLLGKLASLQRYNSISGLKISKAAAAVSQGGTAQPSADDSTNNNLQADIALNFNYIEKSNAVVNVDNTVFANGSFDMSVIDDIKNSMNTTVNSLNVGGSGVSNPFVK